MKGNLVEQTYIVKLLSPLQGEQLETVSQAVAGHLGLSPTKAADLLRRGPGPLTKPVARPVAASVVEALRNAGAEVELAQRNWDDFLLAQTSTNEVDATDATNAAFLSDDEDWEAAWDEDWPDATTESDPVMTSEEAPPPTTVRPRYSAFLVGFLLLLFLTALAVPSLRRQLINLVSGAQPTPELSITAPVSDQNLSDSGAAEMQGLASEQATEANSADSPASPSTNRAAPAQTGAPDIVSDTSDVPTETATTEPVEVATEAAPQPEDPLAQVTERAEAGDIDAQLELAKRYTTGKGVEQNAQTALTWFERAAQAGNTRAQYELGWLYANGIGVTRDLAQAADWYEQAAAGGDAEAQYQLGFYYYYGQGTAQDYEQARTLFSGAAEQGVAEARFRLGVMALEGQGGEIDTDAARRWLQLAQQQGVSEAEDYLDTLERYLVTADAAADTVVSGSSQETSQVVSELPSAPDTATNLVTPEAQPQVPVSAAEMTVTLAVQPTVNSATLEAGGVVSTSSVNLTAAPTEADWRLFTAARSENAATIAETIRAGANVNARDEFGQTPLMYAAASNTPNAIAELVVDLAKVNLQSEAGWTALMYAARDNPGVVEALLVRGADPTLVNADGDTALDIAIAANSERAVALLSPELAANSNAPTAQDRNVEDSAVTVTE